MSKLINDPAFNGKFPAKSYAEWQDLAGDVATHTSPLALADGFSRLPLYHQSPQTRAPLRQSGAWAIAQRITPHKRGTSNKTILSDVEGGANILLLDFSAGDCPTTASLQKQLQGVMLDVAPLSLVPAQHGLAAVQAVLGLDVPATISLYLNYDPLGAHILYGTDISTDFSPLKEAEERPATYLLTASGAAYYAAGANAIQELGWACATLVTYLRHYEASPQDLFPRLTMTLAADVDFFASLAKVRAARILLATLADALGVDKTSLPPIHGETSLRSFSNADPWVNILRATIAGMGAAIGGVDALTIMPCSAASASDNNLTRRLARNTQLILQEESHLSHVIDAAGGSHYVETLTKDMAEAAWQVFQDIEAQGGMVKSIEAGHIHTALEQQKAAQATPIDKRQWALVGVSEFPNLEEAPLENDPTNPTHRVAAPFEALRYAAQQTKPQVFLACLGAQADFAARANFASNVYAAAGIGTIQGEGGTDCAEITAQFTASGAKIAIICGTDDAYGDYGAVVAAALRQAGALHLALAGKSDMAGVDDKIFMGAAILPFLAKIHHHLGLSEGAK